jgi:predicted kinase
MSKPLAYLVVGSTGAGKTTYAMSLADKSGGIRFSIDEWMITLFAADMPQSLEPSWIWERVRRCETMVVTIALQAVARGTPVILDLGFQRMEKRISIAERFKDQGFDVQLHWLDVDVEERWKRVNTRNEQQGVTYNFTVTKPMFDFVETQWEAPTSDEFLKMNGSLIR